MDECFLDGLLGGGQSGPFQECIKVDDQIFEDYLHQLAQQVGDLLPEVERVWQGELLDISGGH